MKKVILIITFLILIGLFVSCSLSSSKNIASVAQSHEAIDAGALVIDVRTPEEFQSGHLDGALNIPHSEIESRISEISSSKDKTVVVYCRSGGRAGIAQAALVKNGFTKVINAGGYGDLKK